MTFLQLQTHSVASFFSALAALASFRLPLTNLCLKNHQRNIAIARRAHELNVAGIHAFGQGPSLVTHRF